MDRFLTSLHSFREAKVLLLGCSDSVGGVTSNLRVSEDRAESISDELAMRGIHASLVSGFSEEMPVAPTTRSAGASAIAGWKFGLSTSDDLIRDRRLSSGPL